MRISLQGLSVFSEAFITLKDHNPNFRNKPTCRLIDPCKLELGKVSQQLVEQFVYDVKHHQALEKIPTTSSIGLIPLKMKTKTCSYSITNTLLEKLLTVASRFSIISVRDIFFFFFYGGSLMDVASQTA